MTTLSKQDIERLEQYAEWIITTCKLYGAAPETGYKVAGLFVEGLRQSWEKREGAT